MSRVPAVYRKPAAGGGFWTEFSYLPANRTPVRENRSYRAPTRELLGERCEASGTVSFPLWFFLLSSAVFAGFTAPETVLPCPPALLRLIGDPNFAPAFLSRGGSTGGRGVRTGLAGAGRPARPARAPGHPGNAEPPSFLWSWRRTPVVPRTGRPSRAETHRPHVPAVRGQGRGHPALGFRVRPAAASGGRPPAGVSSGAVGVRPCGYGGRRPGGPEAPFSSPLFVRSCCTKKTAVLNGPSVRKGGLLPCP